MGVGETRRLRGHGVGGRVPEASVRTEVARNAFAQDSEIECNSNFGCKALEFKAKIPLQEYKKTLKEKLPTNNSKSTTSCPTLGASYYIGVISILRKPWT